MKFTIRGEEEPKEEVKLYLKEEHGYVQVRGNDGKKDRILLSFKNGRFHRHVFPSLKGIVLDDEGLIREGGF